MSNSVLAAEAKARGNNHFKSKDWDAAITEYSTAIELDPNGPTSHTFYSNRSACYAGKEDFDNALADGTKCTELKPSFAKGFSRVGLAYFKLSQYDEAKTAYEDGLKIDPNNDSLKNGLEETERAQRGGAGGAGGGGGGAGGLFGPEIWMQIHSHPELKQYATDKDFIQKVKMLQSNPQMAMQMGLLGDEKIKKLFEVMLGSRFGGSEDNDENNDNNNNENSDSNDDDDDDDTNMTDNKTTDNGTDNNDGNSDVIDSKRSEEDIKKDDEFDDPDMTEEEKAEIIAERKRKSDALDHKNRGNALYKDSKLDEAIEEYKKANELDPKVPSYVLNHSAVLFSQEKWDECLETCKKAVEINSYEFAGPQWTFKACHRMGKVEEIRKNYPEAVAYFKNALLEQNDVKLRKHVSDLEKWLVKREAKEYVDPEKAVAHKEEGNKLFKCGKYVEAIEEYTEAIKRNPKDHVLYSNRATAFCKVMRWDSALDDCDKCLKIDKKFVKAIIRKGKIQHVLKQYHKALETFRKAEEIDATVPDLISSKRETLYAIQQRNMQGQIDPKARERAMQDPDVQAAMNDPEVSSVLLQAQSGDPTILYEAMKARPHIAKKIETLIAAGVLQVR